MRNSKPLTTEEFKEIYSKVPRVCVEIIVRTPEGIALTLRSLPTWHNQWHLPGATVLYKETIDEAVQRAAQDELGISVTVEKLIGYIHYPSEEKERGFGWGIGLAFLCRPNDLNMKPNNDASEVKIFSSIPDNMIAEQAEFLKTHGLL